MYGSQQATWHDARISRASMRSDEQTGYVNTAQVLDRREFWRRTVIDGIYNERDSSGEVVSANEKTVPELAELLLSAMGESTYDISALPDVSTDRPEIYWDCSNPADQLEKICNDRGCSISLDHETNKVVIVTVGTGLTLPNSSDLMSVDYGIDIGEEPQTIRLCGGDILWQARFLLEAIGIDTDGVIKPIGDLGYKPSGGWGTVDPYTLAGADLSADEEAVARQSVFRMYRIKAFADDTLSLPGTAMTLGSISQCFPVNRYLLEMSDDGTEGKQRKIFEVKGTFAQRCHEESIEGVGNVDDCTILSARGHLDGETGIITFHRPIYKLGGTLDTFEEAELYLETSFSVRDNTTFQYQKYTRDYSLSGTGIVPIHRDDYIRTLIASYSSCDTISSVADNKSTLDAAVDAFLGDIKAAYQSYSTTVLRYRGIEKYACDGLNRQVRWITCVKNGGSKVGAETIISQNTEPLAGTLRWKERMRLSAQDSSLQEGSDNKSKKLFLASKAGRSR